MNTFAINIFNFPLSVKENNFILVGSRNATPAARLCRRVGCRAGFWPGGYAAGTHKPRAALEHITLIALAARGDRRRQTQPGGGGLPRGFFTWICHRPCRRAGRRHNG